MSFLSEMNKPNPQITCPNCGSKEFGLLLKVDKKNDQTAEIINTSIRNNKKKININKLHLKMKKSFHYMIRKIHLKSPF